MRIMYLCILLNSLINHIVVLDNLLFRGKVQILHTSFVLLQVDVAQAAVEEDFAGVELELEAQLLVVDIVVATEVEESVVEVRQSLLEIAHEEIGYALLEIRHGKILVQLHSTLVVFHLLYVSVTPIAQPPLHPYRFLVLRERRMNDAAIEQDLGSVGDGVKFLQGLDIFLVVVVGEGCHPRLDFLPRMVSNGAQRRSGGDSAQHTCFKDMMKPYYRHTDSAVSSRSGVLLNSFVSRQNAVDCMRFRPKYAQMCFLPYGSTAAII